MFLFVMPLVFAQITIEPNKQTYSEKETVIFKINVNLSLVEDIKLPDLKIVDANNNEITVAGELNKLNQNLYFGYFKIPDLITNGQYKIRFKDLKYTENNELKNGNFETEINITDNKDNVLSILPGISIIKIEKLDQPKLNFKIQNNGQNIIDVTFSTEGDFLTVDKNNLKINPDEIKYINVNTNVRGIEKEQFDGFLNVNYGNTSLKIPIYLTRGELKVEDKATNATTNLNVNVTTPNAPQLGNASIEFDFERNTVNEVKLDVDPNRTINDLLYFKNSGDTKLTGVKVSLSGGLDEVVSAIVQEGSELEPGTIGIINFTINPNLNIARDYAGEITISSDQNINTAMKFKLTALIEQKVTLFKKPEIEEPQDVRITTPAQTLEDVKGESMGWIWLTLLTIIIILGAFVYSFYKKSKKGSRKFYR